MMTLISWNPDIAFSQMHKLTYEQVINLQVGESIYYVNLDDDISGIVYDAKVVAKTPYQLILECKAIKETIEMQMLSTSDYAHLEGFAFNEARTLSKQILYENLIFKNELRG